MEEKENMAIEKIMSQNQTNIKPKAVKKVVKWLIFINFAHPSSSPITLSLILIFFIINGLNISGILRQWWALYGVLELRDSPR